MLISDYEYDIIKNIFELYYNEGSMNAFVVEINFHIVVVYKLKYYVNGNRICQ